ncbi:flagellar hook-length control protein FliK [Hylemonella sp. W303a]|uniref:flagellar hook-length control protein FliK n=1 Tax=Hylemonella sp. W303a TaxID=3389873 RepID=UPI00396B1FB5
MATDRISTGGPALPLPRAHSGATAANTASRSGEVLTLRIESRDGMGANQVFHARSTDGRLFQLGAATNAAAGMSLSIGQTLQVQVPAGASESAFQLTLQGGSTLLSVPTSLTPASSTETAARLAFAQAQASTQDGAAGSSSTAPDLAQLLAQRFFQGQGSPNDVLVLAQAWRELVLARLRQAPGQASTPTIPLRPNALPGDAGATALSLALLQAMTADEARQDVALNTPSLGATLSQQHPAPLLPQFWMFHAYAWNNTLPLTFWVLPRDDDQQDGEPSPRPANRARMLRLCFLHPVHGLLWMDVRVDEQNVTLDLHADQPDAVAALLQLRPAVSAALAEAGLRLLRYQVRAGAPQLHANEALAAPTASPSSTAPPMNGLPALLNSPETTLAPELFMAAVGVMEALRTA